MSCHLSGPMCSTPGCKRPQRELDGLCTRCWMSLTPLRRAVLQWEDKYDRDNLQVTEAFDSGTLWLELLWMAPAVEPPEPRPYC